MASEQEILKNMIAPLEAYLGEPKHVNPDSFYDVIYEVLAPFTVYQLERGAKHIKANRRYMNWPSPADMASACDRFPHEEPKPAKRTKKRNLNQFTDEHVYSRLHGPIAVEAAKNGWALGLFDWLKEHGELPFPEDEQRIKAQASRWWEATECALNHEVLTADGEIVPMKPEVRPLAELAGVMRAKQDHIAAHILNTNTTKEAG